MTSNEMWAWLAGHMERHGCFTTYHPNDRPNPSVELWLSTTDIEPMQRVQQMIGGKIRVHHAHDRTKRPTQYCIHRYGQAAQWVALNIYPFATAPRQKDLDRVLAVKTCPIRKRRLLATTS